MLNRDDGVLVADDPGEQFVILLGQAHEKLSRTSWLTGFGFSRCRGVLWIGRSRCGHGGILGGVCASLDTGRAGDNGGWSIMTGNSGEMIMPLRRPLSPYQFDAGLPWPSLHSAWIGMLAERLERTPASGYLALDSVRFRGGLEIDIGPWRRWNSRVLREQRTNGARTTVATARRSTRRRRRPITPFDYPELRRSVSSQT